MSNHDPSRPTSDAVSGRTIEVQRSTKTITGGSRRLLPWLTSPARKTPDFLQLITCANPVRFGIDLIQRIDLEGANLYSFAANLAPLLVLAAVAPASWKAAHSGAAEIRAGEVSTRLAADWWPQFNDPTLDRLQAACACT